MKLKKSLILSLGLGLALFTGCIGHVSTGEDNKPGNTVTTEVVSSLNFIFNTESVGETTLTIRRSEWNKMLTYYDYFYKNENNVIAESYEYKKDGKTWKMNTVGLRLRGNTSRFRPQGKDTPTDETGHTMPNAEWSKDYYNYAAVCSDNDYRQSHFKVDFEPNDGDDKKMANCMKGVALKRCDSLFSREIFCYKLFHEYGIWTAPRASQTKVYIKFIEDIESDGTTKTDITDCLITDVDFGVYEMFEEVNKQSLKGRMAKKGNNPAKNAWANNDGDLWKCAGGNLTAGSIQDYNFGCEQVEILNADQDKSQWGWVLKNPCYDLKTNKKSIDTAAAKFKGFLTELNDLSNTSSTSTAGINARKAFYEKWFDVDFFIKTYSIFCLVGMDDDYWGNANNYYLYFDNGAGGTNKCYLIPFDFDNTLGCSIKGDKVKMNPLEWGCEENGYKNDRPLLDRLLEVPEYAEKMKKTLLEVSSQDKKSPWNKENCYKLWDRWHAQVSPYVYSQDIAEHGVGSTGVWDDGAWKETKHYLTRAHDNENIYEQTTLNFRYWFTNGSSEIKFDLNGGSIDGKTGVVTGSYNGTNAKFNGIISNPTRTGYEFLGWTTTKNGTYYTEKYNGEENLTVYASWKDVSSYTDLSIFEIKDSNYEGIKIGIVNLPENNYRRTFYINGKEVGSDSCDKPDKYKNIWAYPFTEAGKPYSVRVEYQNKDYGWLATSQEIEITATSGKGEFKVINNPEYYVENNILKWTTEPVIQVGNGTPIREDSNWDEYFLIEVMTTKQSDPKNQGAWNYVSWNWMGASCNRRFNFKEHPGDNPENFLNGYYYDVTFKLRYIWNNSPYGDLFLVIYDYDSGKAFNLE